MSTTTCSVSVRRENAINSPQQWGFLFILTTTHCLCYALRMEIKKPGEWTNPLSNWFERLMKEVGWDE